MFPGMIGAASNAGGRFAQTRGRIGNSASQGVNYPSPFFDVAHTYLPATLKQLYRWCRYYFLTNPIINASCFKMAEYPITELIVDHDNSRIRSKWLEYFNDHLNFRPFQIEAGLDFFVYGNACISLGFPFMKYLKCQSCGYTELANKIRKDWTFTNFGFRLTCPKCGNTAEAIPKDQYYKDAAGVHLIRWNCENIEITFNELTGDAINFYNIPAGVKNDVLVGKKDIVEKVPQIYIQAMRERKGVVFAKENFFHMKRATIAQQDRGWGIPMILPVLKDTFLLQMAHKAVEAILLEHAVPFRIMFPAAGSSTADPYCVSPNTLVETPIGPVEAQAIKPGMFLRSHIGEYREVEYVKTRYIEEEESVYRFTVSSLAGHPFEVSQEHPILAIKLNSRRFTRKNLSLEPKFIPAKDLSVGDVVAYPTKRNRHNEQVIDLAKHLTNRAHTDKYTYRLMSKETAIIYEWLEENNDPSFAWGERKELINSKGWSEKAFLSAQAVRITGADRMSRFVPINKDLGTIIGYYLAEGFGAPGLINFALHAKETDIVEELRIAALNLGFREMTSSTMSRCKGRVCYSNDILLSELLCSLCGSGFYNKHIPRAIAEADDITVISMLRALFRGDGCSFNKPSANRVSLTTCNPTFALDARRLFLAFGILGGITAYLPKPDAISKALSYRLNFNGKTAEAVRDLFNYTLPSKPIDTANGIFIDNYVLMRIRKKETISYVSQVIGFQMAEDRSFCVAGVATHNSSISLLDWKEHVQAELTRQRLDNNYTAVLPLPIGTQTLGGDGKPLMLLQEMQAIQDQICVGMGVTREFLFGGASWSGSNVSMRMIENQFLGYIQRQEQMATWVMKQTASYMGWPEVKIRFRPFKMADDIQRKAYLFQLSQAGKVSDNTLLADSDLDQEKENDIMLAETLKRYEATKVQQVKMAEIQGEAQLVTAKYQAKAQQVLNEAQQNPTTTGEAGDALKNMQSPLSAGQRQDPSTMAVDLNAVAQQISKQLQELPPDKQDLVMAKVKDQSPELGELVQQLIDAQNQVTMQQANGSTGSQQPQQEVQAPPPMQQQGQNQPQNANQQAAQKVNMSPQPEQKPPRRVGTSV